LVNKKYDVSNNDLLKMLYACWYSRHRIYNIESQGEEQVKKTREEHLKTQGCKM
jgi:hypothetical protein